MNRFFYKKCYKWHVRIIISVALISNFRIPKIIRTLKSIRLFYWNLCADRYLAAEVAESEARSFARDNQLQLLRIKNVNTGQRNDETIDGWTSISECAPVLFTICDMLWKRDVIIAQQGVDV